MARPRGPFSLWDLDVSMEWMADAACRDRQDLPWTDLELVDRESRQQMKEVCEGCRVRNACRVFVTGARIDAAFWAGRWQTPRRRRAA